MDKNYDYLIVGSGLFGATFAHQMTKAGKKCLVIDKRGHQGGNIYCREIEKINVHWYGPHIFHTNDKEIWDFVNSFVEFNRFTYTPVANYKGELYSLPFNMNTFYQLWKTKTPAEAKSIIDEQVAKNFIKQPKNLEEQALNFVGKDIYVKLIKGYTEKQWGRKAIELPAFIIKRLPLRFTYDNNYFSDKYQGIPIGGYNKLVEGLLEGVEVQLGTDFFKNKDELIKLATKIVYTGKLDEYFSYSLGHLQYRSLEFNHQVLDTENYQGSAAVNYTDFETPYTRIVEHKHFEFGKQPKTVITKEYPLEWTTEKEPYYPINDFENETLANQYKKLKELEPNVIFGGRLAEYKYYDMHQVIASSLHAAKAELNVR
ncbi:UDP-galactopyranose mutase [Pedobacter frigiditerrae]|uniref:UDP-galactopyranose mutase n=1 Tax=Pedobacter frigiditerrae TaxID=2530452 RepID=UPI00292EDB23|nr:UDP-galactopyranose mutase [Pedobacter frigiditerrae]